MIVVVSACGSPPPPALARAPTPAAAACTAITAHCDATIGEDRVTAIVHQRCFGCHEAGGVAHHDFTTLDALRAAPIANMVGTCQMPPDGAAPVPLAERTALVTWSACQVGAAGK